MIKYFILAIITGIVTYFLRETVVELNYGAYKDTLGALLNISSIIFAIIGAWIAIIYPRAIGRVFKDSKIPSTTIKEADTDANYLSELVEIVMVSAIVLMVVLSIQFVVPIAKVFLNGEWKSYAKFLSFFVISMLTLSQLYAVFRVILANYFFLNELRSKNTDGKIDSLHK
tara:strand:+ start:1099 stop:1611 length:513 start_codon:yes stop_codon:yes gene_type:complete